MRHKARDSGGKFALLLLLCRHIGLLFGKWLMGAGKKKLRIQIYKDMEGKGPKQVRWRQQQQERR